MTRQTLLAALTAVIASSFPVGHQAALAQQPVESQVTKTIPQIVKETAGSIFLITVQIPGGQALGSGFAASEDGLIVTNYHVIKDALTVSIKLPNGAFFKVLGLVAVDQQRDLAVLKAEGTGFSALKLADSDGVLVGEDVLAIGNPRGLEASVSTGVISGIRKDDDLTLIQTTAPISPGSSGGVLLNRRGEVVGITTSSIRAGQNLNFAVPSNYIKPLLTSRSLKTVSGLILSAESSEANQGTLKSRCKQVRCGTVRLRVSPSGVRILVEGAPVGNADEFTGGLALPPGVYRLSFDSPGFLAETQEITVVAGRTVTARVALKRAQ